jgi:drug/metabolite transporter (DMT)-like permease
MNGAGYVIGAAAAFGTVSILARDAYAHGAEPASLLATRLVVAALVLTMFERTAGRSCAARAPIGLCGLAGATFAGAGLTEFEALARAPAPVVVLLVFVAPVWVALASWLLWHEPPRRIEVLAIALTLTGMALVVVTPGGLRIETAAVALALIASVMSAAFFVLLGRSARRTPPLRAATIAAWVAGLTALGIEPAGAVQELSRPATAGYALAIGGLTACGLALIAAALTGTSALAASALIGVEPLVVALLSWALLGEPLRQAQLAGAAAVLAGVTALSLVSARAPPVPAATDRTRPPRPGSRRPRRPARSARRLRSGDRSQGRRE